MKIFKTCGEYEIFKLRSRAFVTYKDECVPLYRGNILYDSFSYETLLEQFIKSSDWLIANMLDDGRFMYYYDCSQDNNKDHEHPNRPVDNLYYNDLRHCGGAITLVRAYTQTGCKKYLEAAKRAIDFTVSISREHTYNKKKAMYVHYNNKGKLGGTGLALIMMMQYRIASGDKSYDKYIKGYARHIMSRMTQEGELLGYYIHPAYNDGKPLTKLTDEERNQFFKDINTVSNAIHKVFNPDKVNYGAYGDTGHHLHFHLVPKYKDDFEWNGVFLMNPGLKIASDAECEEIAKKLRAAMNK